MPERARGRVVEAEDGDVDAHRSGRLVADDLEDALEVEPLRQAPGDAGQRLDSLSVAADDLLGALALGDVLDRAAHPGDLPVRAEHRLAAGDDLAHRTVGPHELEIELVRDGARPAGLERIGEEPLAFGSEDPAGLQSLRRLGRVAAGDPVELAGPVHGARCRHPGPASGSGEPLRLVQLRLAKSQRRGESRSTRPADRSQPVTVGARRRPLRHRAASFSSISLQRRDQQPARNTRSRGGAGPLRRPPGLELERGSR